MTVPEPLQTARLTLVPFTVEFIRTLVDRERAQSMISVKIPAGWPDEELAERLELYAKWATDSSEVVGYGPWIVINRAEDVVVGSAGFQGIPANDGSVELGFGIHPGYRNKGYATEAALALVAWALRQTSVKRVVANCEPANDPSIRVLERVGMVRVHEGGSNIAWEALPQCPQASAP